MLTKELIELANKICRQKAEIKPLAVMAEILTAAKHRYLG